MRGAAVVTRPSGANVPTPRRGQMAQSCGIRTGDERMPRLLGRFRCLPKHLQIHRPRPARSTSSCRIANSSSSVVCSNLP